MVPVVRLSGTVLLVIHALLIHIHCPLYCKHTAACFPTEKYTFLSIISRFHQDFMPSQRNVPAGAGFQNLGSRESDLKHACLRSCEWPPQPKTCVYDFMIEWFYTAGDICLSGCPNSTAPNPDNVECFQDKDCIPLNGMPRPVIVANRLMPGPSIQVCEGDTIVAHVTNNMTARENEATTIHWHGIHQRGTPFMDGSFMITQCPILIHQTFTYNFTAHPSGTHWWHAHIGHHRMEGLFGSLVVRQAPEADPNSNQYDYDLSEHIIMAHDWHNETLFAQYAAFLFNNFRSIVMDAILMNGRGVKPGRLNPGYLEHVIFNVVQGKRYRFRVIGNTYGYCQLKFSVDHHILKIIALDGRPIEPFNTNAFVTHNAERVDFVLNADKEVGNYWLRVVGLAVCEGLENFGIIHYEGAPEEIPSEDGEYQNDTSIPEIVVNECKPVHESTEGSIGIDELNSAGPDKTPKEADATFYIGVQTSSPGSSGPTFNHMAFQTPSSPLLYQWHDVNQDDFCESYSNCSIRSCKCINKIKVRTHEVVEFVFMNDQRPLYLCHPIHLHGHNFHVVAQEPLSEMITIPEFIELDKKGMIKRKLNSAVIRDTVHIPQFGYLIVRFIANNPGWWLFHCHNEGHLALGLAMVLQVGEDKELPLPPDGFPQCGSWPSNSELAACRPPQSLPHPPFPPQQMSVSSATAHPSSPCLNSAFSSTEVVLLVLLLISSSVALSLVIYIIKRSKHSIEYSPLLNSRPDMYSR